jgi:hypothetical protein
MGKSAFSRHEQVRLPVGRATSPTTCVNQQCRAGSPTYGRLMMGGGNLEGRTLAVARCVGKRPRNRRATSGW